MAGGQELQAFAVGPTVDHRNLAALQAVVGQNHRTGRTLPQKGKAIDPVAHFRRHLQHGLPLIRAAAIVVGSGWLEVALRTRVYRRWRRLALAVLPVTVLVLVNIAGDSRFVRASMLESLNQDYVRTARAKGMPLNVIAVGAAQPVAGADKHLPDADGHLRLRYGVPANGGAYLLRPDQHICARWLTLDATRLQAALTTALPQ